MAMSIEMRRRITANQRAEYADAWHKLNNGLKAVQIGSVEMFELVETVRHDHMLRQGDQRFINRLDNLIARIKDADNQEAVRHIFQWSN